MCCVVLWYKFLYFFFEFSAMALRMCGINNLRISLPLLLLILTQVLKNDAAEAGGCIPRKYSFDSNVCVCNSTYCDVMPKIQAPPEKNYFLYTSSRDGLRFYKTTGRFLPKVPVRQYTYKVNRSVTFQEFIGFGGAFTDSSGINIVSLSEPAQDLLLKSYFSSDGLEYTIGRVPIGGTDFSTRGYTYQDNVKDPNLGSFKLALEDIKYKIPLIKKADKMSGQRLKLVASCWTPPAWMKTNLNLVGKGFLKEKYYQAYADYHVKFLDEYKKQDVEFWCVTTGNEPINGVFSTDIINAVGWLPANQTRWIRDHFGPSIKSSHPDVCILAIDDNRMTYLLWIEVIMADKEASQYINGTAVHWYTDEYVDAGTMSLTHSMHPELFILYTEACYGDRPWELDKVGLGDWIRGEKYAIDIIENFQNWVVGWTDWNLALDLKGGPNWVGNNVDSPIIVNKTSDEFYKQPMYYALAHFSKFIIPGSVRIEGFPSPSTLNVVQMISVKRPDNSVAVVFLNTKSFDVELTFTDVDRGSALLHEEYLRIVSSPSPDISELTPSDPDDYMTKPLGIR